MASAPEKINPSPSNQDQLGGPKPHDNTNVEVKTDASPVDDAQVEAAAAAAGSGDAELEARLRRLEQLKNQYGVSDT